MFLGWISVAYVGTLTFKSEDCYSQQIYYGRKKDVKLVDKNKNNVKDYNSKNQ